MLVTAKGFRVQGAQFRVQDAEFRVQGAGFRVHRVVAHVGDGHVLVRVDEAHQPRDRQLIPGFRFQGFWDLRRESRSAQECQMIPGFRFQGFGYLRSDS